MFPFQLRCFCNNMIMARKRWRKDANKKDDKKRLHTAFNILAGRANVKQRVGI